MSYGRHQEEVGLALLRLLDHRRIDGQSAEDESLVGQLQRQAVLALRDRLNLLGTPYRPAPRRRTDRVVDANRYPLYVLHRIIDDLTPATEPAGALAPSELLAKPEASTAETRVELWRSVGRHLLLGNADLDAAATRPWLHQDRPAWYLVRDAAGTLEALVVLTATPSVRSPSTEAALTHRLSASTVARVAHWYGTDSTPDLAFAAPEATLASIDGPGIHLVGRPEDYARAQRTLAGFVRPRRGRFPLPAGQKDADAAERPGLLAARTIAAGQVRLAQAFSTWADVVPGADELADRFRSRIPRYLALHRSTTRLTEVRQASSPLVVNQQSEMVQQLRRVARARLTLAELRDLDAATHLVAVNTGKALRVQGMQYKNILILDTRGVGPPGARPITNTRERFTAACRDLAHEPATPPGVPDGAAGTRIHRDALAASLLVTHRPSHPAAVRRRPGP